MIDVSEDAGVELSLESLRAALETEVLGGHQELSAAITRRDHLPDRLGRRRERLFADDMLAGAQCGDGQWRVIVVRSADVDNIQVRIGDQVLRPLVETADTQLGAHLPQGVGNNVRERRYLCVRALLPSGKV